MTYDCSSAPMPDIVERLKEHAEWAEANIYEVPITLPDDLSEAIKEIEMYRAAFDKAYAANEDLFLKLAQMKMERDAAVADLDKEAGYYGDLCFFCSKDGDCKNVNGNGAEYGRKNMRLIDADLPMEQMEKLLDHHLMMGNFSADGAVSDCIEFLKTAPTINAVPTESEFKRIAIQRGYVPVVLCKDCKYYDRTEMFNCQFMADCVNESDFCSHGERKEK